MFGIELYMFRTVPLSVITSFSLYTQQWCMSYSLRAGSGRSVLILLASCMTYTVVVCTVKNSWWRTEELSETWRVSFQKWNWEISASSWFHYKNLTRCTVTWTSKTIPYCNVLYKPRLSRTNHRSPKWLNWLSRTRTHTDLRVGWWTLCYCLCPHHLPWRCHVSACLGQLCFGSECHNMNPRLIFSCPVVSTQFLCRIALYSLNHGLWTRCASLCRLSLLSLPVFPPPCVIINTLIAQYKIGTN